MQNKADNGIFVFSMFYFHRMHVNVET
jgi:hypothetical protein